MNRKTVIESTAQFSECRHYRYSLWRRWDSSENGNQNYAMFIGLNPSTADEQNDDPTIRRCIGYAQSWGYSALVMTNLFAYRATDPKEMLSQADPVGTDNDEILFDLAKTAGIVIAAWGTHGVHKGRGEAVRRLLPGLYHLRLTKGGHPSHPLYLPKNLLPVLWI